VTFPVASDLAGEAAFCLPLNDQWMSRHDDRGLKSLIDRLRFHFEEDGKRCWPETVREVSVRRPDRRPVYPPNSSHPLDEMGDK
jgi:hypothetical protein